MKIKRSTVVDAITRSREEEPDKTVVLILPANEVPGYMRKLIGAKYDLNYIQYDPLEYPYEYMVTVFRDNTVAIENIYDDKDNPYDLVCDGDIHYIHPDCRSKVWGDTCCKHDYFDDLYFED